MIQFLLNDEKVSIQNERADLTLLNYLREHRALTGTKEGCASGDCGACTIVIAEPSINPAPLVDGDVVANPKRNKANATSDNNAPLRYKAINSCVTFLSALHGKHVITVEYLKKGSALHPVQQAMVDANATQCGFCTPGFVMSIFALYQQDRAVNRAGVITALSGNLCRCTGYKPIIDATLAVCKTQKPDQNTAENKHIAQQLIAIQSKQMTNTSSDEAKISNAEAKINNGAPNISDDAPSINNVDDAPTSDNLYLPKTRQQLAHYIKQFPDAMLVAGSTDLALLHTQELKPLHKLISLSYIEELKNICVENSILTIGAACTLSEMEPTLLAHFPSLHEIIERFASVPIRNQATLGGNIANASPIGDMAPVLIALNAMIVLDNGLDTRTLLLKEFFTGYRTTTLGKDEWVHSIEIPLFLANQALLANQTVTANQPLLTKSSTNQHLVAYKISKRFEDDISAVCMALNLTLENGIVTHLATGFGGVAATPAFCEELENRLVGENWHSKSCVELGQQILARAFTPLDDVRASADYRKKMLENLWHRFWLETNAQQNAIATRVIQHA